MLEALPEPAKSRVRGLILGLLHRWTSKAGSSTARFTATAATTSERQRGRTVAAAASGTGLQMHPGVSRGGRHKENGEQVPIPESDLLRVPGLLHPVHLNHQEYHGYS